MILMTRYKLSDVYMPVGVPLITFVKRENLERSILSWKMNRSKHLLIFGPSKSGKTTLWKQYVPQEKVIKVSCNSSTTVEKIYSDILFELDTFYTSEIAESSATKAGIGIELSSLLGLFNTKARTDVESTNGNSSKMAPISSPEIGVNLLIKYLKISGKIIVIEDFHYAQDEFKEKISQDLKAFSDDMCPWIIVGVQHKTSKLLSYNIDLLQRIAEISVDRFARERLNQIIELGEKALNICFSSEIKESILDESYGNASLVQNICQRTCLLSSVLETSPNLMLIDDHSLFLIACRDIAEEVKKYYGDIIRRISLGGRSDGSTEKYKWFLKMIRDKDIPEYGLKNTEVLAYLKELGHHDIQQSSVTAGLRYLPTLLDKNNIPSIFDYDGAHFYLLDNYMKFVLKWAPELVDDLFDLKDCSNNKDSIVDCNSISSYSNCSTVYNECIPVFTQMMIIYEDPKAKTAEIQHPVFGKRNISMNDAELIKIISELKTNNVFISMDDDTLFGFESFVVMFYIGFLYAKGHIYYKLDDKLVGIHLTDEAKHKLNIK